MAKTMHPKQIKLKQAAAGAVASARALSQSIHPRPPLCTSIDSLPFSIDEARASPNHCKAKVDWKVCKYGASLRPR